VVVVGGGPAGAATAISLAQQGLHPTVFEAAPAPAWKAGESIPPTARPVLERLGLLSGLDRAGLPSYGNRSVWGAAEALEQDFLFGTAGPGWRVDRTVFEAELAAAAIAAGVDWRCGARVVGCSRREPRGWVLRVVDHTGSRTEEADVVVDASGRAARVARLLGGRRVRYDRLVGVLAYGSTGTDAASQDSTTLVEAVADGWWYSVFLPGNRLVVAFLTDADLLDSTGARRADGLRALLDQAPTTASRVLAAEATLDWSQVRIRPAHTGRLETVAGPDWIAVGDAAVAFDPLASYGIAAALGEGLYAAAAVADLLGGRRDALLDHARLIDRTLAQYLVLCHDRYRLEQRWPGAEFWRRRHHPARV
jgi:2-polyprenyl-6-methoxyphenol hydroxylase-like FAD-dependent oxidoreductase